jgi:peroxiredoxin
MHRTRLHKRLLSMFALVSALAVLGLAGRPDLIGAGQIAPTFTLPDLAGNDVTLDEARGKISLVMFWASWCHPCMKEMPDVQAAFERYKGEGFQVVAVNFGESKDIAQGIVERFGLTFPVLMDRRGNVAAEYSVLGLPLSFFVDHEGVIRERVFGQTMSKEDIERRVQHYLSTIHG